MKIISNTTPLINFSESGLMSVLESLFSEIVVPETVAEELLAKAELFPAAAKVPDFSLITIQNPQNNLISQTFQRELHSGESDCLALALESPDPVLLLLDEIAARQIAKHHRLNVMGTLGCLLKAKENFLIRSVKESIHLMKTKARFWLHRDLELAVLKAAGEE